LAIPVAALAGIGRAFLATINPSGIAAQTLQKGTQKLSVKSEEILGYNFVGLAIQLIIFLYIGFCFFQIYGGCNIL